MLYSLLAQITPAVPSLKSPRGSKGSELKTVSAWASIGQKSWPSEKEMFMSFAIHTDTDSTKLSRALSKMQKEIIKSDRNIYADLAKVTKKCVILTILAGFV